MWQTQTFETKVEIIRLNKKKFIRLDKKARANYTLPKREEMFEEIMAANFLETTKNINNTKPHLRSPVNPEMDSLFAASLWNAKRRQQGQGPREGPGDAAKNRGQTINCSAATPEQDRVGCARRGVRTVRGPETSLLKSKAKYVFRPKLREFARTRPSLKFLG